MADKLSATEHKRILDDLIKEKLDPLKPVTNPRLFMLGGQPGAGKGRVRDAIEKSPQGQGALAIDPDELRIYHPKYVAFVKENPETAASRVHEDAMAWAAELRAAAIKKKTNIIFDGTLGNTSGATGMAKEAANGGYQVEVHVIATSLEVSQQSVRGRYEKAFVEYEKGPKKNAPPRNVPENIQKSSYNNIPGTLEALAKTGVVSRMRVADRSGKKLSDTSGKFSVKKDGGTSANSALKEERTRLWTKQEIEEYEKSGREIEGLMETRLGDGEADGMKATRKKVTDQKTEGRNKLRQPQDAWIRTYVKYKIPAE